jgi:hypothetical protein
MIDTITAEALEAKIRELAAASPDTIYISDEEEDCKYTTGKNGEGCLIGQALVALEPELLPVLINLDKNRTVRVNLIGKHLPIKLKVSKWVINVQDLQDDGICWSECIKIADGKYI